MQGYDLYALFLVDLKIPVQETFLYLTIDQGNRTLKIKDKRRKSARHQRWRGEISQNFIEFWRNKSVEGPECGFVGAGS